MLFKLRYERMVYGWRSVFTQGDRDVTNIDRGTLTN